jgi:ubiquinone biosynthesis protein COQ9
VSEISETILKAALVHIPFDGFSQRALNAAAKDSGIDAGTLALAFPRGGIDLARCYTSLSDRRMLEALARIDMPSLKIRERIAAAIRTNLQLSAAEREIMRRLIQAFALPAHFADGLEALYQTVDAMWQAAGDTANDFNFYTKRMILAAVYSATVLYWLNDSSEDFAQSWNFLDRRIEDVMRIETAKSKLRAAANNLPDVAAILGRLRYAGGRRA